MNNQRPINRVVKITNYNEKLQNFIDKICVIKINHNPTENFDETLNFTLNRISLFTNDEVLGTKTD